MRCGGLSCAFCFQWLLNYFHQILYVVQSFSICIFPPLLFWNRIHIEISKLMMMGISGHGYGIGSIQNQSELNITRTFQIGDHTGPYAEGLAQ
jgi:hypothetical protein